MRRRADRPALSIALVLASAAACGPSPTVDAVPSLGEALGEVSPRFLSFSLDSGALAGFDFSRPALRSLAEQLGPAYLRLGGTASDQIFYDFSDAPVGGPPAGYAKVLTRSVFDSACEFAAALELEIVFTLNAGPGPRDPRGAWLPDNSRTLLEHARSIGCPIRVYELGHEINGFVVVHGEAAYVSGSQYAADMSVARQLVESIAPDARLAGPASAFWPVLGETSPVLPEFLAAAGDQVDIVTWHYYPQQSSACAVQSRPARRETLLDPINLSEFLTWARHVEGLRDEHAPGAEVWLGETGHALCNGEPGLSDRYLAGLWWVDQLGMAARLGQPVTVRQTLAGGSVGLIDKDTLTPRPDYFNSLLWKRLMGQRALSANLEELASGSGIELVRAYSQCASDEYPKGAVTLLVINLGLQTVWVEWAEVEGPAQIFRLSSPDLISRKLWLNDVQLSVTAEGTVGAFVPVEDDLMELPPRSYGFVVLPEAGAAACS